MEAPPSAHRLQAEDGGAPQDPLPQGLGHPPGEGLEALGEGEEEASPLPASPPLPGPHGPEEEAPVPSLQLPKLGKGGPHGEVVGLPPVPPPGQGGHQGPVDLGPQAPLHELPQGLVLLRPPGEEEVVEGPELPRKGEEGGAGQGLEVPGHHLEEAFGQGVALPPVEDVGRGLFRKGADGLEAEGLGELQHLLLVADAGVRPPLHQEALLPGGAHLPPEAEAGLQEEEVRPRLLEGQGGGQPRPPPAHHGHPYLGHAASTRSLRTWM